MPTGLHLSASVFTGHHEGPSSPLGVAETVSDTGPAEAACTLEASHAPLTQPGGRVEPRQAQSTGAGEPIARTEPCGGAGHPSWAQ